MDAEVLVRFGGDEFLIYSSMLEENETLDTMLNHLD